MDTTNAILAAAARAFFVSTWADAEEEAGRTYPGCDLMDVAPETPTNFTNEAHKWLCLWAIQAGMPYQDIHEQHFPGMSEDRFGHYAAMEAMGHGVGLWEYTDVEYPKPPSAEPMGW